jgi:hypothetical protein
MIVDSTMISIRGRCLMVALLLACATACSLAQGVTAPNSGAKDPAAARQQAPADSAPKPAAPHVPGEDQSLYLVRATLLTLNDANRSGNYTVLRDLASPGFQAKNTAADLALSFADLRKRNFDLFSVALLSPKFTVAPAVDANGKLRLKGFFPSRPLQIDFDLIFEVVGDHWRLLAISVATPQAASIQSTPAQRHLFYGVRILSGTAGVRW